MTTQDVAAEQENQLTPEQEAAEDAAFEAGFNAVNPIADETTSENNAGANANLNPDGNTDDGDEQARLEAEAAAEAERKAREEAEAPVTITKGQFDKLMMIADEVPNLREQMTKTHDTVAGRIGSLQQTIKTLQERAGQGNRASIKQLKRLEEEFPQLAQLLKEDLSEAFGPGETNQPSQLEQQQQNDAPLQDQSGQGQGNPLENPEVQKVLQQKEMAIVEAVHPGFRQLAATPEFSEWKATLPPVAVNLLDSSWDAQNVMIPAFNDFKKWKQQREAAKSAKQQNDKRLERGIAPTDGAPRTGQHVVDEDAAFEAGFNAVRKR
jgi:hypothetical protein